MAHSKSIGNTFVSGLCVHACTMTFGVHTTHEAVCIEWQLCCASQFASDNSSLIETAFTFTGFMQRHRHDNFRAVQRLAALHFMYERNHTSGYVSLSFQLEDRSTQGAVIRTTRPGESVCVVVAPATTNLFAPGFTDLRQTQGATLPAKHVLRTKQVGARPTCCAGYAVMT